MPQTFRALRCAACGTFQVRLESKSPKWTCLLCNEKQSVVRVYVAGPAKQVREVVQKLNAARGAAALAAQTVEPGILDGYGGMRSLDGYNAENVRYQQQDEHCRRTGLDHDPVQERHHHARGDRLHENKYHAHEEEEDEEYVTCVPERRRAGSKRMPGRTDYGARAMQRLSNVASEHHNNVAISERRRGDHNYDQASAKPLGSDTLSESQGREYLNACFVQNHCRSAPDTTSHWRAYECDIPSSSTSIGCVSKRVPGPPEAYDQRVMVSYDYEPQRQMPRRWEAQHADKDGGFFTTSASEEVVEEVWQG